MPMTKGSQFIYWPYSVTLTTENKFQNLHGGQGIEAAQPVTSVYFSFNTLKRYPVSFKGDKVLIILTG